MKNIKLILMVFVGLLFITGCVDDDNDELTGNSQEGGLLKVNNLAVGYVVGNNSSYTVSGTVYQGDQKTINVKIYKSFTNTAGESSNEILFDDIDITNVTTGVNAPFSTSFTYEDLIDGLILNGSPLPTDDSSLNIGDFWTLRFESTLSDGRVVTNYQSSKVSVGTRFAGIYRTLDALYYRIGVLTAEEADWPAETIIESVDATTYRVVEYFGLFNGNEWYFQIDSNDMITYPANTPDGDAQTGNGQPFITCESNPSDMVNVPCGAATNIVVRDDVNGKDQLIMTYGYYTAGSGSREFYQVLEKIVQ